MSDQTIPTYENDEISMLDILLALAESWKLLVFGPLIAGVLAGGLSFLLPKTYESVAVVRLTEEEVAFLHVASVLDPLIEKFGLLEGSDGILEDARESLKTRIVYVVDKKTKLVTVAFKGQTPDVAQKLGRAALDMLLVELLPKGKDKEAIEQEIAINNQMIADALYLVERETGKINTANTAKGQIVNLKLKNLELGMRLKSKGKEIFAQEPSLPQRKVSPNSSMVVLKVILLTGFVLLMFVFIRKALASIERDSATAAKLIILKTILGVQNAK